MEIWTSVSNAFLLHSLLAKENYLKPAACSHLRICLQEGTIITLAIIFWGTTQQLPDVDDRNEETIPGENAVCKKTFPTGSWELC